MWGVWKLMDGWPVHGGTRAAVLCPMPTHAALETWGGDPGLEPALTGVGGALSRPLCSALRHLLTPRGHREPSQVPAELQITPHRKRKCGSLAFSSRETQGRMEWGSQDSRDPPDHPGLLSTCQSRT